MFEEIFTGKPKVRIRPCTWNFLLVWLALVVLCPADGQDYTFHLLEESSAPTLVGQVSGTPNFAFVGSHLGFSIDQSGIIHSTTQFDRESGAGPVKSLRVRTGDNSELSIKVVIEDINDNDPTFKKSVVVVPISENVIIGSDFPLDTATDQDAGLNGTVGYSLVAGNGTDKFELGVGFGNCSRSELCLITKDKLDREARAFYQLKIIASDRGTPPLQGHCLVNITISDYNDNAPVFDQMLYNGSVAENSNVGVRVFTVKATDSDENSNAEVRYSLEAGGSAGPFQIDPVSGVISTDSSLDRESTSFYTFDVIAQDSGLPPLKGKATVDVYVEDVNEFKPQITVSALSSTFPENTLHHRVAFLVVSDTDKDQRVNVTISSGNELGHFAVKEVFSDVWLLSSVGLMDREQVPIYNLTIEASDNGRPSLSAFESLIITLEDLNDNPPTFFSSSFDVSVNELVQPGSFVFRLNASDADLGTNSLISYSILQGVLDWFHIDSTSGIITTAASLDRETHSEVVLTVVAKDHGSPKLNGSTSLNISLLDGNDFPPQFNENVYNESLSEDARKGSVIVKLTATDKDIGENGRVTYKIDSGLQEITDSFAIDLDSGELTTKVQLNREKKDFYDIQIVAKDHGKPQLSTRTSVHLSVTDVNDNNPIYYPVVYYKTLSKGEPPQEIIRVSATDVDLGNNGRVLYEIAEGNDQGLFAINQTSGVIRTVIVLSTSKLYQLNLTARDGGGLIARHGATVHITVLDVQDDPPVFKHAVYNYSMFENVPKGTLVGRVFATTNDSDSKIDYSIVNGDPGHLFVMDSAGGIIKVHGMIDREEKDFYRLGVVAQVASLSAIASVNVKILDENDNIPEFPSSLVQVTISANLLVGGRVYHAQAIDADAGLNGIVKYQLTDDASGHFKINATSGVVELASPIVSRDGSLFLLKIRASDLGSPPRHALLTLTVKTFTNHPPRFPEPTYTVPVSGNVPLGKQFHVVSAIDSDQGDNGLIQYSIVPLGNTEDLFGIFADGSLYVKKPLSQAKNSIYDITVIAEDKGSPALNASAAVHIIIQDSTEHRTLFTNSTYRFSIPENCLPGKQVGFLKASANDPVKTMGIVYSFVSNQRNFVVDAKTGEITTIRMLDREGVVALTGSDKLIMQAQAVYNDTKVMRDRAVVVVQISDLNDNLPAFSRQLYQTSVLEDSMPGTVVSRLSAIDPDSASNAKVVYSIAGGSGSSKFGINTTSGVVLLKERLDRELVDHYELRVHAMDAQDSPRFSETLLEIRVEDSNDNRPSFGEDSFVVNVSESLPVQSVVTVMNATDRDMDINAELVYTISSGNLEAVFSIDHSTGAIILDKSLDYETVKEYRINVTVKDQGNPVLFTQAELLLIVNDANDNRPVFVDRLKLLSVPENITKNSEIGRCIATDEDSGLNGKIVYNISTQEPGLKTFGVDPHTCAIYTLEKLDREAVREYKVIITATDQAVPTSSQLVATKEITVQIDDSNDNTPRFVSPLAAPVAVSAGSGTSIMTVAADDPDEGTNGQVTYTIISGNTAGIFYLDANTGELKSQNSLDHTLVYTMTVLAEDGGKTSLRNSTTMTVFKEGAGGPLFTSSWYMGSVVENSTVGQSVLTVRAAYSPAKPSARVEYFVTSDNSKRKFGVDKNTGIIRTLDLVDHESPLGSVFILKVFAVDLSGPASHTSSTDVEIRVTDTNDNRPEFLAAEYRASIAENSASGVVVTAEVSASDKDSGENRRISYSITGGNEGGQFTINSSSGVISTTEVSLDREVRAVYRLTVTAQDNGSQSLSSVCTVVMTVTDVNDNAPQFTSEKGYYSFAVYEDADVGARVGAVSATDSDIGENALVFYHFPQSDVFGIEPSTGVIQVTGSLDRETEQLYLFNVSASDNGHASSFIAVYISILDRNDNAPSFASSQYSAKIVENADINSPILTVSVVDRDHGTNAVISYNIVSGNNGGIFSILPNGTILNSKHLDREKKSSYLLEVTATDQAQPISARLSCSAYVRIIVTDVNDHTPYFASKNVTHVSENAQTGDVVMTVLVVDFDEGSNSDIVFSLRKIDPSAPFSLGSKDGILKVKGKLDRENRDHYSVEITASDQGNPSRSSKSRISIIVDDFNDHPPVFQPHNNVLKISEDTTVLTEILHLSATDDDLGTNAKVRFDITSGNTDGAFFINPISGSLETAKPLDRETVPNYSLEICAHDLGIPQQSTVTLVSVLLLDVNDNSPRFEKPLYTAKVLENHLVNGIKTVVAQDLDEGRNGQITYEIIHGDSEDAFVIDPHSGVISLKKRLDRERKMKYTLWIKASDGGQTKLSDQTEIIIEVLDENDNDPVFHPDVLKASVLENMPSGTQVTQVSATDLDDNAGSGKGLTYSLDNSSPEFALFKIDPTSGKIVTQTSFDRERDDQYKLKVYARDNRIPERTGTATIDVTVGDVNDNDPEFTSDRYVVTVENSVSPGGIVFVVSATDKDSKTNAESSYTITSNSFFEIDSKTGIITVVNKVPSNGSPYSFTVEATNEGAQRRTDSASLQIQVTQGPFPYFLHSSQSLNVSEIVPAGSNLLKLNATGHTMYRIAAGNTRDKFEVDVQGYLKVKNTLDYGVQTNYVLVVEARDGSSPPKAGYVRVSISVTDENNNPPIFSEAYYQATVEEEQPSNQTVIWVSASDADAGLNAETEYSIVQQGSGYSDFDISPKTGRLFSTVKLNRESVPSYSLKVRAKDVRDRSLWGEATVQVTVRDVNDNAPVFEGSLSVSILETANVGSDVIMFTTVDKDEGSNAVVKYDFANSGNPGSFFNISSGGKITLSKKLDHEKNPELLLQVTASDSQHITSANLTVKVLDVNDNPPQFRATPYIEHVNEKSPVGTPAMNVSAFDADTGSYAESLYSILPSVHSDLFTIERKSGVIKLNQVLFYQKSSVQPNPNMYNLTVKARNVWSPFFEEIVSVVIQVDDINDHTPKFTSAGYFFSVTKGSGQSVYVGKITAVDNEDDGDNAVVRYSLDGGNGTSLFSISAADGRVTTAKNLQTPGLFHVKVQAKDLGSPSKENFTNVFVDVTETNAVAPKFESAFFSFNKREDLGLGSVIDTVTATDSDIGTNGQITYAIASGNSDGFFGIGHKNGSIYAVKSLDYEFAAVYHLNITATDGGLRPLSGSTTVRITLSNVNDNPPVFSPPVYQLKITEGAQAGTVVGKVSATDQDDSPVTYEIDTAEMRNFFSIDSSTGVIKSKITFDYEIRNSYHLSVVAKDADFSSQAQVHISVTGVNEFSPKFDRAIYRVAVAENASPGLSVGTLTATDQDKGPDGEVVYLLVGSHDQGFSLEPRTGILSVSGQLDSEKHGLVTLEVIVKNFYQDIVTPENSDQASVVVTVTDANDEPRFLKSKYRARVAENAGVQTFVANVTAVDDDAHQAFNAKLVYSITQGNIGSAFHIDSATGVIRTAGNLDRETIPQYRLTVSATDDGLPPLSGYATVVVDLGDVNDNPPTLVNCTGHVRENKPIGSDVTVLQPTDLDISPNQGSYTFSISKQNFGKFELNSKTGEITTIAELDREQEDKYNLSIKITDNGSPQQAAVSHCLIIVDDENDNSPLPTSRMVHMTSFDKNFAGGPVGNVQPEDVDQVNSMTCQILSSSSGSPAFTLPAGKCELDTPAYQDSGEFTLKLRGSDGKASVDYDVTVKFLAYTAATLNQSVVLRLKDESPQTFLQKSYTNLLKALNDVRPSGYSPQLLSVRSGGEGFVDVVVAVQRDNSFVYLNRDKVVQLLVDKKSELESGGKIVIANADYMACTADMCLNQAECTSFMKPSGFSTKIETIPVIFHSANYAWHYSCLCKRGYAGRHCESISDACSRHPCKNEGSCENLPGGYRCTCKPGFTGKKCEAAIDFCTPLPCKFNSTCKNMQASYQCKCDFGGRGKLCQHSSLGFDPVSYMALPTLTGSTKNNITLQFATSKQKALLFYNADGQYKKDSDFIALEIVGGKLRFSFNLGEIPVVIKSPKNVADGNWHTVVAVRNEKRGELVVDSAGKVTGTSQGALMQLNLYSSPLFIGGVKDFEHTLGHPAKHISSYDFVGCMRELYVNGKAFSQSDATEMQAISNRCPRVDNCASQPCQHGGKCLDKWFEYICECMKGYMGRNCEKETRPFTFSGSSFMVMEFKEDYRREQAVQEKGDKSVRRRRAVGSGDGAEEFTLKFRTRVGGVLLLAEDAANNYTVLEVRSSWVYYSFKTTVQNGFSAEEVKVSDGEWHTVTLKHVGNNIDIVVDGKSSSKEYNVQPHSFLGSNIKRWSLGGFTTPPPGETFQKFKGCMEALSIDGVQLSLDGPNRFATLVSHGGSIGEGCSGSNLCHTKPCNDPDTPYCFLEWETYTCISDAQCKPNPCKYNGTCLPQKDGSFKCKCHTNYTGDVCQVVPACQGSPCEDHEFCQGVDSSGYECVPAGRSSDGLSTGIIAAIVFFVLLIIVFIIVVFVVRRHRLNQRVSKTAGDFDGVEAAADVQDASQRTSPSHSSDDSGVVIKNPSQKSLNDLRAPNKDHNKGVVIHDVGAPENYQIKLTKSNEKIDHGFSESDGEFIMRNKYNAVRPAGLANAPKTSRPQMHRSNPVIHDLAQRTANHRPGKARKLPNPHFKYGRQQQPLSRTVLDPRRRPPSHVIPNPRARRASAGSLSSDEMHDFTDTGHCSDFENNSEMIEHYDIDVASIGFSEISYQYDPNQFKDPANTELPGLSPAEIERLQRHAPSGSLLDAVSLATSDNGGPAFDKLSSILEPPDTSSESSDDTFTCSEFECDEHEEVRVVPSRLSREEQNQGSMVFSRLPHRENEGYQSDENSPRASVSTMSDDELMPQTINGSGELFNWDDLLNWGLRYHNLRGVYKDIAQLKDSDVPTKKNGAYV